MGNKQAYVIAAQRHIHDRHGLERLRGIGRGRGVGHHLFRCGAASQNARLRRIDNGAELVDAKHAQVRDGERSQSRRLRRVDAAAALANRRRDAAARTSATTSPVFDEYAAINTPRKVENHVRRR